MTTGSVDTNFISRITYQLMLLFLFETPCIVTVERLSGMLTFEAFKCILGSKFFINKLPVCTRLLDQGVSPAFC